MSDRTITLPGFRVEPRATLAHLRGLLLVLPIPKLRRALAHDRDHSDDERCGEQWTLFGDAFPQAHAAREQVEREGPSRWLDVERLARGES